MHSPYYIYIIWNEHIRPTYNGIPTEIAKKGVVIKTSIGKLFNVRGYKDSRIVV